MQARVKSSRSSGAPGLFRRAWTHYAEWFRADFHPWNHDNRAMLETWRGVFGAEAARSAAA